MLIRCLLIHFLRVPKKANQFGQDIQYNECQQDDPAYYFCLFSNCSNRNDCNHLPTSYLVSLNNIFIHQLSCLFHNTGKNKKDLAFCQVLAASLFSLHSFIKIPARSFINTGEMTTSIKPANNINKRLTPQNRV